MMRFKVSREEICGWWLALPEMRDEQMTEAWMQSEKQYVLNRRRTRSTVTSGKLLADEIASHSWIEGRPLQTRCKRHSEWLALLLVVCLTLGRTVIVIFYWASARGPMREYRSEFQFQIHWLWRRYDWIWNSQDPTNGSSRDSWEPGVWQQLLFSYSYSILTLPLPNLEGEVMKLEHSQVKSPRWFPSHLSLRLQQVGDMKLNHHRGGTMRFNSDDRQKKWPSSHRGT
jgi:hypothetical protein